MTTKGPRVEKGWGSTDMRSRWGGAIIQPCCIKCLICSLKKAGLLSKEFLVLYIYSLMDLNVCQMISNGLGGKKRKDD